MNHGTNIFVWILSEAYLGDLFRTFSHVYEADIQLIIISYLNIYFFIFAFLYRKYMLEMEDIILYII